MQYLDNLEWYYDSIVSVFTVFTACCVYSQYRYCVRWCLVCLTVTLSELKLMLSACDSSSTPADSRVTVSDRRSDAWDCRAFPHRKFAVRHTARYSRSTQVHPGPQKKKFNVRYGPIGPLPSTTPLRLPLAFLATPSCALLFLGTHVGPGSGSMGCRHEGDRVGQIEGRCEGPLRGRHCAAA